MDAWDDQKRTFSSIISFLEMRTRAEGGARYQHSCYRIRRKGVSCILPMSLRAACAVSIYSSIINSTRENKINSILKHPDSVPSTGLISSHISSHIISVGFKSSNDYIRWWWWLQFAVTWGRFPTRTLRSGSGVLRRSYFWNSMHIPVGCSELASSLGNSKLFCTTQSCFEQGAQGGFGSDKSPLLVSRYSPAVF